MSSSSTLPSIAERLAPLLQRVPRVQQPLLIALAERMAAERYREWAAKVTQPDHKSALLACADREEEIARRVEALYPTAASTQRELLEANPDLIEINRSLFAPYSLEEQFKIQAQGERVGAATWRAFAKHETNSQAREVLLGCALLEEENAAFLESLAVGGLPRNIA
ncbi:MAG: hypothetical protein M3P18_17300 [Actinomycetota bacterium]|nr:hypothetical protein [Actinomycetota bacterium]